MSTQQPPLEAVERLRDLDLLDRTASERIVRLVELTAGALGVHTAAINLMGSVRQHTHASVGADLPDLEFEQSLCPTVVAEDAPLPVPDATLDGRFAQMDLVREGALRFYLGAPIHDKAGAAIGTLCVFDEEPRSIDERDVRLLTELAAWVEQELNDNRERHRAAAVQQRLFPASLPAVDGWQLAGACAVSADVGGDLYDWRLGRERRIRVLVADVMGKGVGAALLMASLRAVLRAQPDHADAATSVAAAATALREDVEEDGTFATLAVADADLQAGSVDVVDAGHGLVWHVRHDGTIDRIAGDGPPIGLPIDAGGWAPRRLVLAPGDALVLASDGLLDHHPDLDAATAAVLAATAGRSAAAAVQRLTTTPHDDARPDDLTAVVLRRLT